MSRRVVWLQLLIGWLPVWGLFTLLIVAAHENTSMHAGAIIALRSIVAGAALGIGVQRLLGRFPWPHPVRVSFVMMHLAFAVTYAVLWVALNSVIESALHGALVLVTGPSIVAYLVLGVWLYVMVAGVSYTSLATERAARAEANAAQSQLAALRSQLHPHFLFNALHSVVHLIPREPRKAAQAAELLAGLLRVTIEEDRDVVSVAEELSFVERYLELERMRFGDRLRVSVDIGADARAATIPLFALQTLVENAVRHGAAPSIDPTDITVAGVVSSDHVTFTVRDTGVGASDEQLARSEGTGLRRLRERLSVLYGREARLDVTAEPGIGFSAVLMLRRSQVDA